MASTTVKPFPHVQINVKDNSIASVNFVEVLPVHRPLYVMRTQEGPLGKPTWCNTYSEAVATYGEETFNAANKIYFSKSAKFLLDTMTYNGAFIVRYLPNDNTTASYVLFARVAKNPAIKQYEYQNGQRVLEFNADTEEWVEKYKRNENDEIVEEPGVTISFGTRKLVAAAQESFNSLKAKAVTLKDGTTVYEFPLFAFEAKYPGAYANDLAVRLFYNPNANDPADVSSYQTLFYNIGFFRREYDSTTVNAIVDIYNRDNLTFAANPETVNPDSGASMGVDYALDKSFSDEAHQLPVNFYAYESSFAAIGNIIASYEADTKLLDQEGKPREDEPATKRNETYKTASLNGYDDTAPIGALTEFEKFAVQSYYFNTIYGLEKDEYGNPLPTYTDASKTDPDDDPDGHYDFVNPVVKEYFSSLVIKKEILDEYGNVIKTIILQTAAEGVALLVGETDTKLNPTPITLGYMVNGISCVGITGIPYDHAVLGPWDDEEKEAFLNNSSQFFLENGSDGTFIADDDTTGWATDDRAMYDFCRLQLPGVKDTIVESLHYPFTHIFDVGFTMKTKKAILKFLDVRDDFMAIMSTQVLMTDGSGRALPMQIAPGFKQELNGYMVNDQAADEAALETLRSYALLMRESVLFGTDCMRAAIYCHTGILAAGPYVKPVPYTYWSAMKYAEYGNLVYMKADEPRGLPNAYNLYFKEWNWNNYRFDTQSRVWDNGGNYCQYADMTRLFYPALRTVYRAATSVLVDEWFVAAVVYAKYVAKRAWATFSGRNDTASILQGAIKQYLDKELAALFNNKYTFETSVYQTADEQEIGYIQHVKISITSPATMRVLDVDIEVNREGFTPEE